MKNIARAVTKLTSFAVLLFPMLLLGCSEDTPEPIDLMISNVTLVDAVNPLRHNQTVLIDGGRIVDIVSSDSASEIVAIERVDASDPRVMGLSCSFYFRQAIHRCNGWAVSLLRSDSGTGHRRVA